MQEKILHFANPDQARRDPRPEWLGPAATPDVHAVNASSDRREPRTFTDAGDLHFALRGISMAGVSLPAGIKSTAQGTVDPHFLSYISTHIDSFGGLPSAEKCNQYRRNGAALGAEVILGSGAVIIAPQIVLGDGVQIGEQSSVICRERFVAGQLTSFRSGLSVRGATVVVGENIFAGSRIQIGGGGNSEPWAVLCVGDSCYLGDDVFINVCRPVIVGKEVFLTQRTILVSHNLSHSILEGQDNVFKPVVLCDYSQIGMNCTVYAGVRIGRSAIVASNSYVVSSIPDGKLAIGVPAKVVRDAVRPPDRDRQLRIVNKMVADFHELLSLKGHEISPIYNDGFSLAYEGKRFQLAFLETYPSYHLNMQPADESIIWALETRAGPTRASTLINLLAKTIEGPTGIFLDSTREFLRKRGIRCQPGPWRYKKGLL